MPPSATIRQLDTSHRQPYAAQDLVRAGIGSPSPIATIPAASIAAVGSRTTEIIAQRRAAVVAEALSWVGTPYRTAQRVKGRAGGVDCLTLVAEVYERTRIVPRVEIPFYPPDWHLHRGAERYLEGVLRHAREVAAPEAGDLALFRFGRCFAHGAIVTAWPLLVHAWNGMGVVEGDATQPLLAGRAARFFSPFLEQ